MPTPFSAPAGVPGVEKKRRACLAGFWGHDDRGSATRGASSHGLRPLAPLQRRGEPRDKPVVDHDRPASERQLSVTRGLDDQPRPPVLAELTTTLALRSEPPAREQGKHALPHDGEAVHEEHAVVQRHERQVDEGGQRPDDPVRLHDPPKLFLEGSGRRL